MIIFFGVCMFRCVEAMNALTANVILKVYLEVSMRSGL